ncbi:hypothetical protein ACGF0D_35340 [Kitasatospora sp. NPDC048298]|uniref:hypothetical protein n=1 Tax=Kitasatospora sp. NPDC048298 TaxID=3364049 RepID=UPI003717E494
MTASMLVAELKGFLNGVECELPADEAARTPLAKYAAGQARALVAAEGLVLPLRVLGRPGRVSVETLPGRAPEIRTPARKRFGRNVCGSMIRRSARSIAVGDCLVTAKLHRLSPKFDHR